MICVYIDMVNVVWELKCIWLKYMLETINYKKLILLFIGLSRKCKINLFFDKKRLEFREILFVVHVLCNTNSQ